MALLAGGCGSVQWQDRVDPAVQRAQSLGQLVLVQFHTMTDGTCGDADRTVFTDPDVLKVLHNYQCVRLDYFVNRRLAESWGVSVVPTYLTLRPNGSLIDRRSGVLTPDEFRAFLVWSQLKR